MKLSEAQIGWLAGIVDGEGSIQITTNGPHLRATVIVLVNTNNALIQTASNLLTMAGIENRIGNLSGGPAWRKEWRPAWNVQIMKIDSMKAFLSMISPYLVAKKEQAEIAMQFLSRRRSYKPHSRGAVKTSREDLLLRERIQKLNKRGASESVETVRPPRESEMIQSELHSDMQSQAEMPWPKLFN